MQGILEGNEAPAELDDEEMWEADQAARRRRRIASGAIAALVVVVLAAVALVGFRSGSGDEDPTAGDAGAAGRRGAEATTATTGAPTPTTAAGGSATTAPTDGNAPEQGDAAAASGSQQPASEQPGSEQPGSEQSDSGGAVLADGKHPVFMVAVDPAAGTLEFDLVQWLTGDAADEYVEAHPDEYPGMYEESGGYPYDELVINDNPRLRTMPVADGAQAKVLWTGPGYTGGEYGPRTIPFAELPAYLEGFRGNDPSVLSPQIFWLTVRDGEIVGFEETFRA